MYKKQELGKKGEQCACDYLIENNYEIIERNFYCRQGEIDIIAKDLVNKEIVFIEVKSRTNILYGRPSEAVTKLKMDHLKKCVNYYLYKNKLLNYFIRIDVIEVYILSNKMVVNHIRQVI